MSKIETEIIAKISPKTLGFITEDIREHCKKGAKALFRVYGQIVNIKYGSGDNGPWTKFVGQFESVNLITGLVLRSGNLFLPNIVSSMVEGEVIAAKSAEGFGGFMMAYEIGVKKSPQVIGYEYTVKNLLPGDEEKDVLLKLRKELGKEVITSKK